MQAIEIVGIIILLIICTFTGGIIGRKIGIKIGQNLRKTDHFIYRSYPQYKQLKTEGKREDEIIANLLIHGTEQQTQELIKFYDKYEERRGREEVKQFKQQFKDEPIGKKIVDTLPFKY